MKLLSLSWDPDRIFFVIPYINHPVTWYGLLFASGFLVGYFLVRKSFTRLMDGGSVEATRLTDRLTTLVVLGTLIGARLGHVFFYSWPYFRAHPFDIFKVWEGGLASHGGAIGILIALCMFALWNRKFSFLTVLDIVAIPAAFVGGCIRIGNFINQEITGIPTKLPWGVTFGHPVDGLQGVALHPVQLYESLFYFATFLLLYQISKRRDQILGSGLVSGLFFVLVFSFRFAIEFLKNGYSDWVDPDALFHMGQLLSLPFIGVGLGLLAYHFLRAKNASFPST